MIAMIAFAALAVLPSPLVTPGGVAGIDATTTLKQLEDMFADETIEHTREHLGEGYYSEGSSVWRGTDMEIAVVWNENGTPMEIRLIGEAWRTADGIGLGSTLTELEAVIGEFEIAGFAWDNEGYADLWETPYEGIFIRLLPRGPAEDFIGDSFFPSSSMRSLNPVVVDFRVFFF